MSGSGYFSWIGTGPGSWNAPENWAEVTTGQTPAVVAPGSLDVVIFGSGPPVTVSGNGSAAGMTVQGADDLAGTLNSGTLVVDQPGTLDIDAGATVSAVAATNLGTIAVDGGASLLIRGTLRIGSASLAGTLSGPAQTAALVLSDNPANYVDASKGIVVGALASSIDSGLLIEPGITLSGGGSVVGSIVDNGSIVAANLTLGQPNYYEISNNPQGYGPPITTGYDFTRALSGTGTVEVQSGGKIDLAETVAASGLTFQLDGSADLDIQASIASGNTINLIGNLNTITVDAFYYTKYTSVFADPGLPIVDGTIGGLNSTDTLIIVGDTTGYESLGTETVDTASFEGSTLTLSGNGDFGNSDTYTILTLNLSGMSATTAFSVGNTVKSSLPNDIETTQQAITIASPISCFASGTHIATPHGAIPINRLREGDTVLTASGQRQPIKWIGWRRVDCRCHPAPAQVMPIRIMQDAFGENLPKRALLLSPDHCIFSDAVLIPVKYLVNGTTIAQVPTTEVTYYHVELPHHDLLLTDGMAAESYLDVGDRSNFVNGGDLMEMHPGFTVDEACEAIWESAGFAPLRIEGEELDRVVAKLHRRAILLGQPCDRKTRRRSRQRGVKTTDPMQLLNPIWYLANNPDVSAAGVDATVHYVTWGRDEGRLPCPETRLLWALGLVDPGTIAFTMADVVVAGVDPVAHFCNIGWRERRRPNLYFDTGWYLDAHDVPTGMNPLLHYVLLGEPRGLSPSPHFDPVWYRQRYSIGPTCSPLAHYLKHRRSKCVSPVPTFDVGAYIRMHAATLRPNRDPYAHMLVMHRFTKIRMDQAGRLAA